MRSRMFSFILAAALGLASGAAAAQTKPPIKTDVDATFAPRMAAILVQLPGFQYAASFCDRVPGDASHSRQHFFALICGMHMKKAENAKPERKKLCVN